MKKRTWPPADDWLLPKLTAIYVQLSISSNRPSWPLPRFPDPRPIKAEEIDNRFAAPA